MLYSVALLGVFVKKKPEKKTSEKITYVVKDTNHEFTVDLPVDAILTS